MSTFRSIAAARMARQGLIDALGGVESVVGAVRRMVGAHAQVQSAAEHSIARRLEGVTQSDVRAALWERGELVRTYGPRGTVHLLPAEDLHLWLGALAAVDGGTPRHADGVRLEPQQVEEVIDAVESALARTDLTLVELDAEIGRRLGAWAVEEIMPAFGTLWPRWRQAITSAAHRGALCFGPPRGRALTYSSPRRLVTGLVPAPAAEAVPWLVAEYRAAYGPSSPAHLARWLATTETWTRAAWESAGDEDTRSQPEVGSIPELVMLPYFDAYVVASQPREELFVGRARDRALAGSQAGNVPVLLVDGVVGGAWHGRRSGTRWHVTIEPFETLTRLGRRRLEELVRPEVERTARILQARPEVTIGDLPVGPHA